MILTAAKATGKLACEAFSAFRAQMMPTLSQAQENHPQNDENDTHWKYQS